MSATICNACGELTSKPRRGLCFRCYQRERRGAVLPPEGAACECGERRRAVLSMVAGEPRCFNCLHMDRIERQPWEDDFRAQVMAGDELVDKVDVALAEMD